MSTDQEKSEAKPRVKIVFDGVMAVGPGHSDGETRPGPFFGVMARSTRHLSDRSRRLRREREAKGAKRGEATTEEKDLYIPVHVPTVFTQLKPTPDSRPPDQVLQLSPVHPRWYLWHPIRERLEFQFDGDGTPGDLRYHRVSRLAEIGVVPGHIEFPATPVAIDGVENVPDLRQIWPERSVLLDGLLSADPGVSEKVATQVLVPYGTVAGGGTLERGQPLDVVFDPVRNLPGHPSLVPNAVVIVDATAIEIAAFSLDSGERLDSIKLQLTKNAEIWVSNGDPSDVEIDMERLAQREAELRLEGGSIASTDDAKRYTERIRELMMPNDVDNSFSTAVLLCGHGRQVVTEGLGRDYHRAGNVDLDFEVYYMLMKNAHLEIDGLGLPVPKRPNDHDEFVGPNCLVTMCETNDRLFLKSQSH